MFILEAVTMWIDEGSPVNVTWLDLKQGLRQSATSKITSNWVDK